MPPFPLSRQIQPQSSNSLLRISPLAAIPSAFLLTAKRLPPKDGNGNIVDPFVVDGTTYLPVRAVSEALGKTVTWDGATATVYIGQKPGAVEYMTDALPAYEKRNSSAYKEYSNLKSGGTESFNMGGVKYLNGLTFGGYASQEEWAVYNLNGQYVTFSGTLCHIDGTAATMLGANPPKLQVMSDGVLKAEYDLSGNMSPRDISIDVTGAIQLKLIIVYHNGAWFGIGNPILK